MNIEEELELWWSELTSNQRLEFLALSLHTGDALPDRLRPLVAPLEASDWFAAAPQPPAAWVNAHLAEFLIAKQREPRARTLSSAADAPATPTDVSDRGDL